MQVRLVVTGLGNVGRRLLELIEMKRATLRTRLDLELLVVSACDSTGSAANADGLDLRRIIELKRAKQGIAAFPEHGRADRGALDLVRAMDADVLVELTLTNLQDGEPGLSVMRAALNKGWHVVTANKGPLVLAYPELARLASAHNVRLLHSATVTGGLPTLNLGARDLLAADILEFQGVVNGTTNYILSKMAEGVSYADALEHAQEIGMAEADPTLDVDGWDAASKLVIIANAVLRRPTTLKDVAVEGIRGVTVEALRAAEKDGRVIKLVARAEKRGDDYALSVQPTRLDKTHPLASIGAGMMGSLYRTDINGAIFARIEEEDPYPTAAGVLRDIVTIYSG